MICKQCRRTIPDNSAYCNWCGKKQLTPKQSGEISVPAPRQLSSGKWFIQLRVNGTSVSITEPTRELCVLRARATKTGLLETKAKPQTITLSAAITEYIAARRNIVSPSTIRTYVKHQRLRFLELQPMRLCDITPAAIQKSVTSMSADLSAKTVRDAYAFLKSVLASKQIELDLSAIALPSPQPPPYTMLDVSDIQTLIYAIVGNPCEIQILLALWLGLRRSEILPLEKSDFDFSHKTVTIRRALVMDENNTFVPKGAKCAASVRVIACPDYILNKISPLPDGLLYQHSANYIINCLHRVCAESGLPPIRLHDLRHVNASIMLLLDTPDKYIMERGGWACKQTFTGRYEHTLDFGKAIVDDNINTFLQSLTPT